MQFKQNCHSLCMEKKKELIANFTDKSGIPIDLKVCYILHTNTNTIHTFYDKNIYFDANKVKAIICLDYKNDIYFIDGESLQYLKLEEYSYSIINLYKVEEQLKTAADFRSYIGIK